VSDHESMDDHEELAPTPGQRAGKFLKQKDIIQTIALGLFFTAVFVVLGLWFYPKWMPEAMSKEMVGDEGILKWFTVISAPIAGIVLAISAESFMNRRKGNEPATEDGAGIKTHGPVVLIWSAVSGLFCVLAIVWGIVEMNTWTSDALTNAPHALVVDVTGSQWAWSFEYPSLGVTSHDLYLPVGVPVQFNVVSADVNHSFWPVQLGVKVDANRLETTVVRTTPDKLGHFDVKCAELCGLYHAYMETNGEVVTQANFNNWIATAKANGGTES